MLLVLRVIRRLLGRRLIRTLGFERIKRRRLRRRIERRQSRAGGKGRRRGRDVGNRLGGILGVRRISGGISRVIGGRVTGREGRRRGVSGRRKIRLGIDRDGIRIGGGGRVLRVQKLIIGNRIVISLLHCYLGVYVLQRERQSARRTNTRRSPPRSTCSIPSPLFFSSFSFLTRTNGVVWATYPKTYPVVGPKHLYLKLKAYK